MNLASWGPLGRARGALVERLGSFLGRLGAILSVLERSFGDSRPPLDHLRGLLGLSWTVLGPPLASGKV